MNTRILATTAMLLLSAAYTATAQNVSQFYEKNTVLNYSDGEKAPGIIPQPEAFDPDFHIYLCFGQSNMEGNAKIETQDRQNISPRFRMMAAVDMKSIGRERYKWYAAVPPLCREWTGLTPADYFGRTLVERLPENIKVGIINVAVGGASITLYDEDSTALYISRQAEWFKNFCKDYDNEPMRRLMECAKRAQQVGVIKGILLHQGCTDNGQQDWPNRVKLVYERMLQELHLKAEDCPLLVGELMTQEDGGCCWHHNSIINRIQQTIPTAHPVSSLGCQGKSDKLHFTAEGYRTLGRRYAEVMLSVNYSGAQRGLKDAYKDYFKVGVALNTRNFSEAEQQIVLANYNSVTCENAMKAASLHPAEGVWRWENADSIANWCRRHGIPMRGHCLVWHNQFSDWMMYDKEGRFVEKEVFYQRLREHIHTVMHRYKDIVYCWDVVNEAIADQQPTAANGKPTGSPYRESNLHKLCGDEFIAKAFQFAREADPNALLFYNDYNAADKGKCQRICNMVKKMKAAGVPIDGIGMQGHYNIYGPSMEDVSAAIERYATLVDHLHITELDIRVNQEMGGQLKFSRQGVEIKPEIQRLHTKQYAQLFKTLRQHKDVIDVVTFWNLSDRDSWLGTANYPLLFDKDFTPKQAYFSVRDFAPASCDPTPNRAK